MITRICNICGKQAVNDSDMRWQIANEPVSICLTFCGSSGTITTGYDLCISCLEREIKRYGADLEWKLNSNAANH